ncbi:hypothetical protein [Sphingomonas baiyangensis]|uniref:Uncharacterized protein n=1 Tax=Sphingomonas baiyangensis TaxID=2572576 RepID=A0A4U1L398_9SPHN|nr:hypothetical protein [Sphingomonas baiyangensis]TKD50555.1 hypothetical protein FBR43_07100 [Sphingomonas baiyangensis]
MVTEPETSHAGIIEREGGPAKVAAAIRQPPGNVKAWKRTNSIPAPYWQAFVDNGLATYKELASAAAVKAA